MDRIRTDGINRQCFQIKVSVELDIFPLETCLALFKPLVKYAGHSWIKAQKALLYYNHRGKFNV